MGGVTPGDERCLANQVWAPVVDGASAPNPPPAFDPYVIVTALPESESPETVMVCPSVETVPVLAVT